MTNTGFQYLCVWISTLSHPKIAIIEIMNQRVIWIDGVKAICILMVVLHHSLLQIDMSSFQHAADPIVQLIHSLWGKYDWWIAPARMPVFFFLSGFLASKYVLEKTWSQSFHKRITFGLWLFLVWDLILFGVTYLINRADGFQHEFYQRDDLALYSKDFASMLPNLLIGNGGLWYIYALVLYFIGSKLMSKHQSIALLSALAVYVIIVIFRESLPIEWGTASILRNFVFFALGAFRGKEIIAFFEKVTWPGILTAGGLALTAVLSHKLLSAEMLLIGAFAAIAIAVILGSLSSRILESSAMSWLLSLGKGTLYIYMFHVPLLQIAFFIFDSEPFHQLFSNKGLFIVFYALYPLIFTTLVSLASILIGKIIAKVAPVLLSPPRALDVFGQKEQKPLAQ